MDADGVAAVEVLRAELARAKEQARCSDASAEKASAELKAKQAAWRQDEKKISTVTFDNCTSNDKAMQILPDKLDT